MKTVQIQRTFKYKGKELADVPGLSLKDLARHHSTEHPELANTVAEFVKLDAGGNTEVYEYKAKMGPKG